jgi:glycerol uptake facilitator-like aquaporin
MTRIGRAAARRCALETAELPTRPAALVELITTVLLALSTVVAATAVSIGIARADVFGIRADADTAPFAIALLIGLLLLAMGGLTAIMADGPKGKV